MIDYDGWGKEDVILKEDGNMQPHRSIQEPQCDMSYFCVASQLAGKTPKFSVFSGDSTQKDSGCSRSEV